MEILLDLCKYLISYIKVQYTHLHYSLLFLVVLYISCTKCVISIFRNYSGYSGIMYLVYAVNVMSIPADSQIYNNLIFGYIKYNDLLHCSVSSAVIIKSIFADY